MYLLMSEKKSYSYKGEMGIQRGRCLTPQCSTVPLFQNKKVWVWSPKRPLSSSDYGDKINQYQMSTFSVCTKQTN